MVNMSCAQVPRQNNFCDCGVFLLHYFELFAANPERALKCVLSKEPWFDGKEVSSKRRQLRDLIIELAKTQQTNDNEQAASQLDQEQFAPGSEDRDFDMMVASEVPEAGQVANPESTAATPEPTTTSPEPFQAAEPTAAKEASIDDAMNLDL